MGLEHDSRLWPLTTHAHENPATGNFLEDEMSPEELRAHAYAMAHRGQSRDVIDRENIIVSDFQRKLSAVLPVQTISPAAVASSEMVMDADDRTQSNGPASYNGIIPINDPFAPSNQQSSLPQPFFH